MFQRRISEKGRHFMQMECLIDTPLRTQRSKLLRSCSQPGPKWRLNSRRPILDAFPKYHKPQNTTMHMRSSSALSRTGCPNQVRKKCKYNISATFINIYRVQNTETRYQVPCICLNNSVTGAFQASILSKDIPWPRAEGD